MLIRQSIRILIVVIAVFVIDRAESQTATFSSPNANAELEEEETYNITWTSSLSSNYSASLIIWDNENNYSDFYGVILPDGTVDTDANCCDKTTYRKAH